ncbi:MAG TPA: DeoR/GlpR family DNA-binding transcription regulator [Nocardioidaceae bacterium]|nr:DeoR/GlpR family DNA-binding transcription regulator [Nocardioidaceae bacterium]
MLAQQRQALIVERVRRLGAVRVADLTEMLEVSDMTVRRDLEALAARGLVEKVHGGATAVVEQSADEPGFAAKVVRQQQEKEAIARRAVTLITPGAAIGLTAGTTTWTLARHLGEVPDITVVTNSVPVADLLHASRGPHTVILTGGLRTPSDGLVGPVADAAIRSLHVDLLFMGVHGMDAQRGFTTPNLTEAQTNREWVRASRRLVVLADHTKAGTVGLASMATLDEADVLVTDDLVDDAFAQVLDEHVSELMLVSAG